MHNLTQVSKFPPTRFMGSKTKLLAKIWEVSSEFKYDNVIDLFSGSGIVSYMFKAQGKNVLSNDYMYFSAAITKSLVENCDQMLSLDQAVELVDTRWDNDSFVAKTFDGLYFSRDDNEFIDSMRVGVSRVINPYQRAIAMSSLVRACLKKRPRGIFTYTGMRYDDGRRDLRKSFREHFLEGVKLYNNAVFDGGGNCESRQGDALSVQPRENSLVYIDPPYYSPLSDNEYVRLYHFVEGLARDWKGVEIQKNTKTKKFKSYPTPFSSRSGAEVAFDNLFHVHRHSILIVSYSSNSLPAKEDMLMLMSRYKKNVDVIPVDHRYSFGNQAARVGDNRNKVQEYLFVGH